MTQAHSNSNDPTAALVALESAVTTTRMAFACIFSSADEYERALITARRAEGRYGASRKMPVALLAAGAGLLVIVAALLLTLNF